MGVGSPRRLTVLGGSWEHWEVESVEQDAILRFCKLGMPYLEHLLHGHGKEALQHFEQMCEEGVMIAR